MAGSKARFLLINFPSIFVSVVVGIFFPNFPFLTLDDGLENEIGGALQGT